MTFVSLFDNSHGFLASDQRVYGATELSSLSTVLEQAEKLGIQLADQTQLLDEARDAAQVEGHTEGVARGEADAKAQFALKLAELHAQYQQDISTLQDNCAQMAVDIVRRIAGQIATDEWLYKQATSAAEEMIDQPAMTLRVHADQVDAVQTRCDAQVTALFAKVVGDEGAAPLSCVLETVSGRIEVDLDTQLENILQLLAGSQESHD